MDNQLCCNRIKNFKSIIDKDFCKNYLLNRYAFGRYDITSTIDNKKFNTLNSKDWNECLNDEFVNCAIDSKKFIYIFFKVGNTYIDYSNCIEKLSFDLRRSIDGPIICNEKGFVISQFSIELLQMLCINGMHVTSGPSRWNSDLIYFQLTRAGYGYSERWTNLILEAIKNVTEKECSDLLKKGGSIKKINIYGKVRNIYKIRMSNMKDINMIKYNGNIVPLQYLKNYKKRILS